MTTKTELVERMQPGELDARQPSVLDLIRDQQDQFVMALNDEAGAKRLTRILLTEIRRTPRLGECTTISLLGAAMQCAQHRLEPGPVGHCYLVPIWNGKQKTLEVEWWLGYKGMMELARRSGRVQSIYADDVRPNDHFHVSRGSRFEFNHTIDYKLGRGGEPYAYYAYAELDQGHQPPIVLTPDEVNTFRDRSMAYQRAKEKNRRTTPWHTDYRAMALKTCIRRLFTWLPMSIDVNDALAGDEQVLIVQPDDPELTVAPSRPELGAVSTDPFDAIADTQNSSGSAMVDASVRREAEASVELDGETQSAGTPQDNAETTYTGGELRARVTAHTNREVTVPKALRAIQAKFPDAGFTEFDLIAADPEGTDWLLTWIDRGGKTE